MFLASMVLHTCPSTSIDMSMSTSTLDGNVVMPCTHMEDQERVTALTQMMMMNSLNLHPATVQFTMLEQKKIFNLNVNK